jgi:hypothetical protein
MMAQWQNIRLIIVRSRVRVHPQPLAPEDGKGLEKVEKDFYITLIIQVRWVKVHLHARCNNAILQSKSQSVSLPWLVKMHR